MEHKQWIKKDKRFVAAIWLNVIEGILSGSVSGLVLLTVHDLFTGRLDMDKLIVLGAGIIGFFLLRLVLYTRGYTTGHVGGAITTRNIRLFLGDKIRRLPLYHFSKEKNGRYINVITHDVNNYENILTHKAGDIVKNISLLTMMLFFLFSVNPRVGSVNFLSVLLIIPAVFFSFRVVQEYGGMKQEMLAENVSDIVEYITGIQTLRSYGMGGINNQKVDASLQAISDISYRFEKKLIPVGSVFNLANNMGVPLSLFIGGGQWLRGDITAMQMAVCIILPLYVAGIGFTLFIDLTSYKNLMLSKQAMDQLAWQPEESGQDVYFQSKGVDVTFRDVSFGYCEDEPVLKHVSFTAETGQLTAIVGDSGAGKSTILDLIAKFYEPQSGEITIGGTAIRQVKAESVHQTVSMVDQEVFLFNDTIRNNIKLAKASASDAEIANVCQAANCAEFIAALEQGYDTVVGENGTCLSGGERQRISIARAMLKDSPILLLDEATASLDIENELAVKAAVVNLLKQNKTVIMVAHTLSVIQQADQILVLSKGKVVERGIHKDLMNKNGKYFSMWQAQTQDAV